MNLEQVPIDYQDYDNEASEWAEMVADNRIAELAEIDKDELSSIVSELDGEQITLGEHIRSYLGNLRVY